MALDIYMVLNLVVDTIGEVSLEYSRHGAFEAVVTFAGQAGGQEASADV